MSWDDGGAKEDILRFVERVRGGGSTQGLPAAERIAVFDNDGTLWCEKPMPVQLDFILRRLAEMAEAQGELRGHQPWKAAYERDYGWLSTVIAEHYAGEDRNVRTLGRGYLDCAYAPMIELLRYLEANGFSNYIASGGGRDFMRPISEEVFGVPSERVIGSSAALAYTPDERGGTITRQARADYLDDGPEKPVHIWSRTGRRPVLAAGNSNGDIPMLGYTDGAEQALDRAKSDGWTVVSVKNDWARVF